MDLALLEDRLEQGGRLSIAPAPRVVYVVSGRVAIADATVGENAAWHGTGACALSAEVSTRLWRWELWPDDVELPRAGLKLRQRIELPAADVLMRADRVDFPPRGIAYTHTHQGPGIRVLLRGRFRVEAAGHTTVIEPGEPWFERGPDPVYAESIADEPTSFVRVMILPAALRGQSSIRYAKPEDQARPKSQSYTVFVDAPLEPGAVRADHRS